jgi:hypothetical protein
MQRFDEAVTAFQAATAIFRETSDEHYDRIALHNLETARAAQQAGG